MCAGEDGSWVEENNEENEPENGLNGRKKGRAARILLPYAPVSFRARMSSGFA